MVPVSSDCYHAYICDHKSLLMTLTDMRKIIFSAFMALLALQVASAQAVLVSGNVTSADDGLPLPGVSVVIQGTTQGTSTDLDGNYSISVQSGQTVLFTSIGFKDQLFTISGGGQ